MTKAAFQRALEASARAANASTLWDWLCLAEESEDPMKALEQALESTATEDRSDRSAIMSAREEAKCFGRTVLHNAAVPNTSAQARKLAEKFKLPEEPEDKTEAVHQKYLKALEAWKQSANADGLRKEVRALRASVKLSTGVAKQKLDALEGKLRQLHFFEQTLRAQRLEEAVDCPVCYEAIPVGERCILPCAHVGCTSCFMTAMAQQSKCPVCRAPVQCKELMRLASPAASSSSCQAISKASKYGSKIQALLNHLQQLLTASPDNRIILFVQWEDLRKKVGAALQEFGMKHSTLEGNVWRRQETILQFQGGIDGDMCDVSHGKAQATSKKRKPKAKARKGAGKTSKIEPIRILLLSLEHSASGTNFTAANHVVLFHPMLAETPQAGAAFEMQAIGRALRYGQKRTVEVWRFVTADTAEQQITEQHSEELWQRFRAQRVIGANSSRANIESCDPLRGATLPGARLSGPASSSGSIH